MKEEESRVRVLGVVTGVVTEVVTVSKSLSRVIVGVGLQTLNSNSQQMITATIMRSYKLVLPQRSRLSIIHALIIGAKHNRHAHNFGVACFDSGNLRTTLRVQKPILLLF